MKVANILIAALIIVAYLVMIVICIIQGGKIEAIRKAYDDLSVRLKSDIVVEVINDIKPDIIDKITDINTALCSLSSELSRNQGEVIELKNSVKTCEDDIEKINKVDYDWGCEDAEMNEIKELHSTAMTNEETIKSLSTEGLADLLSNIVDCYSCKIEKCDGNCVKALEQWLKSEVKICVR